MNAPFAREIFATLPSFEQALASSLHNETNALRIGRLICELAVEDRLGIAVLHRHFAIRDSEYVVRSCYPKASFTFVRSDLPADSAASCWTVDPDTWLASPIEYVLGPCQITQSIDPTAIRTVARRIGELGLASTYALMYLPTLPDVEGRQLYELTDTDMRLSMVSDWQDPTHRKVTFSRSTFSFMSDGQSASIRASTKCTNCPGCHPVDTAPFLERAEIISRQDLFGLGIDHAFERFGRSAVTSEVLAALHRRTRQ